MSSSSSRFSANTDTRKPRWSEQLDNYVSKEPKFVPHLLLFESRVRSSTLLQLLFFSGQAGHEWLTSNLAEKFSTHCLVLQDAKCRRVNWDQNRDCDLMKMLFSFSLHIMALCLVGSEGESCHKLQSSSFS